MAIVRPPRWLSLGDPSCTDRLVAGAKAARLAQAAALGFPVPESVVVPCAVSAPVLDASLARASALGPHAGRLEVMAADPVEAGLAGLTDAVESLGPALAVRSSSPAEDTPTLAGAFSSLMGVAPAEVTTAVLAVWASAIMTRSDADDPDVAPIGVLIQPELVPDFAGSAEVLADGSVSVIAIDGPAGPLMAGWAAGLTAAVDESGQVSVDSQLDQAMLQAVADLARRVHAALGDNLIEWAWDSGRLWLVQARRADRASAATAGAAGPAPPAGDSERLLRATTWPGDLAERWLLPWILAAGDPRITATSPPKGSHASARTTARGPRGLRQASPDSGRDPLELWQEFTATSDELIAHVWGARRRAAPDLARAAAAVLRLGAEIGDLAEPDPALARRCLALAADLMSHLQARRIVRGSAEFWALPADLGAVLTGRLAVLDAARRAQLAALRWEPARFAAIQSSGERFDGIGVADGFGCGPCLAADEAAKRASSDAGGLPPRAVIVAAYPLPQYAPLLMGAAGLVTRHGSEAAHLITVARALGVPAVIGPWLLDHADERTPTYAAVDGTTGTVHVSHCAPVPLSRPVGPAPAQASYGDHAFYKMYDRVLRTGEWAGSEGSRRRATGREGVTGP